MTAIRHPPPVIRHPRAGGDPGHVALNAGALDSRLRGNDDALRLRGNDSSIASGASEQPQTRTQENKK